MTEPVQNEKPTAPPPPPPTEKRFFIEHDLIPIPLLVGIFAVIWAFIVWIQKDNWKSDMTRYQSIAAQSSQKYEKAIEKLEELRTVNQGKDDHDLYKFSPTYLSEIGFCYYHLNKLDKSLEYYNLAQQYRTNQPLDDSSNPRPPVDFHNMIGYVKFKQNDLEGAEKAFQEALKFNKLDALTNFTLGEIAMKRNDFIKAADYFKVVADNPGYQDQVKAYYAEIEKKLFAGIS